MKFFLGVKRLGSGDITYKILTVRKQLGEVPSMNARKYFPDLVVKYLQQFVSWETSDAVQEDTSNLLNILVQLGIQYYWRLWARK